MDAVLDLKTARSRLRGDPDSSRPLAGRAAVLLCPQPCLHTRVAFETVTDVPVPEVRLIKHLCLTNLHKMSPHRMTECHLAMPRLLNSQRLRIVRGGDALLQGFRLLGGGSVTTLVPNDVAANAGEELADTARLVSHMVDCIVVCRKRV